jgi:hypothetical protein
MKYPEFAHIGFKIICTCWFISTSSSMSRYVEQKEREIATLQGISISMSRYAEQKDREIMMLGRICQNMERSKSTNLQ